jgi:glycine/D-amino acid oxidase-like deaminating enzyme
LWRETSKDESHVKVPAVTIEEEPFGSETMPCYMIPRGENVVVGGTYLVGDEEKCVRESERERILKNARIMGIDTSNNQPVGEWVGFRPYRSSARLELDVELSESGMRVVHNYGFGGSGWTVFVGAAREAVSLVTRKR